MGYRRNKKLYYKRHARKRTFTRFNTYKNRSAKAQAYQIYALNRRVNNLRTATKPEMKEYITTQPFTGTSSIDNNWASINTLLVNPRLTFGDNLNGNSARLSKLIVSGLFARSNNVDLSSTVAPHQFDTFKYAGYVRIAVIYFPNAHTYTPDNTQFFQTKTPSNFNAHAEAFKAPLIKGCGSKAMILKVKRYKITNANVNNVPIKFTVNLWKLNRFKPGYIRNNEEGLENERGSIFIVGDILQDPGNQATQSSLSYQFDIELYTKLLYYDA